MNSNNKEFVRCSCCGADPVCKGKKSILLKSGQWVKIIRPDDNVQYAQFLLGDFFLGGSGFSRKAFEAKELIPLDNGPEQKLQKGYVYIDLSNIVFKAVENSSVNWNGWSKPWIEASEKQKFIDFFMMSPTASCIEHEDGSITLDDDWAEPETLKLEYPMKDGVPYYYVGNLGWIWEFISEENYEKFKNQGHDQN